jgi:hypothetical protein
MNTKPNLLFTALAVAALLGGCGKKEEAAADEHNGGPPKRVRQGADGETIVTLDEAMQTRIGLKIESLAAAQLGPEVKGFGRVVDPAALASLVADFTTARAANDTSQAEFKRLKTLASQNNASERALQTAEAAAVRDQAQFESARLKLLASWGAGVADRSDLPAFIQSLGSLDTALVRVDLPPGNALKTPPVGARIVSLAGEQSPVEGKFFGQTPAVDLQTQNQGFLFLVEPNTSRLAPGAAVTAYLKIGGEPVGGVVVPRAAVVRYQGAAWIYIQSAGTNFTRRVLSLDRPAENGWFITSGVAANDRVVVTGAQALLSEELNASGFQSGERE